MIKEENNNIINNLFQGKGIEYIKSSDNKILRSNNIDIGAFNILVND